MISADEKILDEMLECNSCENLGTLKHYDKGLTKRQKIDKMMDELDIRL